MICLGTPSTVLAQSGAAKVDSVKVLTDAYRAEKAHNIDLRRELVLAGSDLSRATAHHEADKADFATREAWLKSMLPKWYEKPILIVTVTAFIVIWATLRAVQIAL